MKIGWILGGTWCAGKLRVSAGLCCWNTCWIWFVWLALLLSCYWSRTRCYWSDFGCYWSTWWRISISTWGFWKRRIFGRIRCWNSSWILNKWLARLRDCFWSTSRCGWRKFGWDSWLAKTLTFEKIPSEFFSSDFWRIRFGSMWTGTKCFWNTSWCCWSDFRCYWSNSWLIFVWQKFHVFEKILGIFLFGFLANPGSVDQCFDLWTVDLCMVDVLD